MYTWKWSSWARMRRSKGSPFLNGKLFLSSLPHSPSTNEFITIFKRKASMGFNLLLFYVANTRYLNFVAFFNEQKNNKYKLKVNYCRNTWYTTKWNWICEQLTLPSSNRTEICSGTLFPLKSADFEWRFTVNLKVFPKYYSYWSEVQSKANIMTVPLLLLYPS